MIFTHTNPDLDAIFTTLAYCLTHKIPIERESITFIPANQMDFPQDSILIDLEKNKHAVDRCALMEYESLFPEQIIQEINIQDCYHEDLGSLQLILIAFKKSGLQDFDLLTVFEPIVRGLMKLKAGWEKNSVEYDKIPIVDIGKYKFYKLEHNAFNYHNLTDYGLTHGITGKVYLDKYDMGVVRFGHGIYDPRSNTFSPNMTKLPPIYEPKGGRQWFQHPNGFLISWGTYKSPAIKFPRAFDNLDQFIEWLDKKFKDYNL
jgi:hypothetical protein